MGHSSSKNSFPESRYYIVLDYKYCKVWKRRDNQKETMQQYQVCIQNQQDLIKYQKMWQIRTQQESVVNVYYFNHHHVQQMCSSSRNASILTERIPYRLSQFHNIPYQEILSIIKTCFKAFKILYEDYGLFKIKSTMLGINCQQKLKVWHHTDFSNPQPENTNCKSLLEMLRSIVNAIQLNADEPFHYVRFSCFLDVNKDRYIANFDQILQVLQTYRRMNNIPLSQSLPQIKYYMRNCEGEDEQSSNTYLNTNFSRNANFNLYSPQREVISSHNNSPAYLKPSSVQKYKSCNRVSPSLHQSRKTIKRNPSINIYTHKEVNRILESQKQLSNYLVTRQSLLNSPPHNLVRHTPSLLFHPFNQHLQSNFKELPKTQRNQFIYRGDQLSYRPIIIDKDMKSGDMDLQNRRNLSNIQKMIQKRQSNMNREIQYRLEPRLSNRDLRKLIRPERTARFEISTVRSNSLSNSKSKQTNFIFL